MLSNTVELYSGQIVVICVCMDSGNSTQSQMLVLCCCAVEGTVKKPEPAKLHDSHYGVDYND